jgi:DNA polymerase alpha subunit A
MSGRQPRENKKKNARLEAMQAMKDQKAKAESGSALASFELEEDEDVFDTMDETEYADVVEKRRNAGDFVVDDGECTTTE